MINKDQQIDQLLTGISRLCSLKTDCARCAFYESGCVFGEPKPKNWKIEDKEISADKADIAVPSPIHLPAKEDKPAEAPVEVKATSAPEQKPVEEKKEKDDKDTVGTWLVSTTMGSVFTKYVYICSKCGYKKESVLSIAPTTFCPECEKRKKEQAE